LSVFPIEWDKLPWQWTSRFHDTSVATGPPRYPQLV
jgi:hypothetical protein